MSHNFHHSYTITSSNNLSFIFFNNFQMASFAMKGRAWTRKEDEALCRAYRWVSENSVRENSQTSEGVWTRVSKKYLEFYESTTPPNTRNHESCSSRWKKHLHPSLNKWHQALLTAASRHEIDANYYDEVSVFTIYF